MKNLLLIRCSQLVVKIDILSMVGDDFHQCQSMCNLSGSLRRFLQDHQECMLGQGKVEEAGGM